MSGYFDIVVPETTTNYALNPIGGDTDNITAVAGTTVTPSSTTYSYLGPYSVRVETNADNEGAQYTLSALANAIHYVTVRVRGTLPAAWDWSLDNSTFNEPSLLSTEGDWWVYGYSFPAAQASAATVLYILQKGAGSGDFYLGHVQVEAKEYATTPVTGDLEGCYWTGAAKKSTSVRRASTRSGGRVYDLDTQYGFYLADYPNIGAPDVERYQSGLALLPGSLDEGHKIQPREFILVGEQSGTSWNNMHLKRKQLMAVLSPDLVKDDQPVILRYRGANSNRPLQIAAHYLSGMQFTDHQGFTTRQGVRLRANDPYWYDPYETTTHLTTQTALGSSNFAFKRDGDTWSTISGTDFDGQVNDILVDERRGRVYFAGAFTAAGGVANTARICALDSTGFTALGTGAQDNAVVRMALQANGDLWAAGNFTSMGGDTCDGLAMWDYSASAWIPYNLSAGANVRAVKVDNDGDILISGNFTSWDADTDQNYVAKLTAGTTTDWNPVGTSPFASTNYPYCMEVVEDDIYIGTYNGGASTDTRLYKFSGGDTTWSVLATVTHDTFCDIYDIARLPDNSLLVAGLFDYINGVSGQSLAHIVNDSVNRFSDEIFPAIYRVYVSSNGKTYVAGGSKDAPGIYGAGTLTYLDITIAGSIYAMGELRDTLYIGGSFISFANYAAAVNTITNNGTAIAYPKIFFRTDGGIYNNSGVLSLINNTTGAIIDLNYTLQDTEELTIDFNPQKSSCKSSLFGDRWTAIRRGSDFSSFYLLPGANSISVLVYNPGGATITSYLTWRNAYESADGTST